MGYEICGFIEQKNAVGVEWEPAIILTHMDGDFSPQNLDVSYIWSCGRTTFNEELVRYSTPVSKTHIREIGKKLKPVDSEWGAEDSQPDEMLSISYGSLCYIASKSETPELAEYFVEQVERNLEILGLDETPPDLIRFTFVESY